jgi:hypothetical protein
MPVTQPLAVKKLSLDTHNFRTLVQADGLSAIHALIAIEPEWFWALMDSLIDDGYLPTENIIILEQGKKHIVKEGNRRIAALKIIHGLVSTADFSPPIHIAEKIAALPVGWKKANAEVPCTVYAASEEAAADKVVTLTHGKGEKAGRVRWSAVARARHNRDKSGASEPALDLLEKFLAKGKNVTTNQSERWAGEYPLSVLDEAIKRLAGRLGVKSAPDVAKSYPRVANRPGLEDLLFDIGLKDVGFKEVRADDFGTKYGMPPLPKPTAPAAAGTGATGGTASSGGGQPTGQGAPTKGSGSAAPPPTTTAAAGSPPPSKSSTARPIGDPRTVATILRKFKPKGSGRSKLATLLEEVKKLDIDQTPHAFCFVLRSMFEVSAKAYCDDHAAAGGPKSTQANGYDRKLVEMLKDIVRHLTANNADTTMVRLLHGAITELANPESVLSVTSMNQLVHNPAFSASPSNICIVFGNVFPLLEAMNK